MKTPGFAAILVVAGGWLPAACDNDQPVAELPQANDAVSLTASSAPTLEAREAAVDGNPLRDAYFGDTHVHTSYSLDAYIAGTRLTPADAYRFAKGETMVANGQSYRLGRPLDFAAISDHAENLGEMYSAQVKGAPGYDAPELEELRNLQTFEAQEAWFVKYVQASNRSGAPAHPPFYAGPGTSKRGWQVIVDAARAHYEPGRFTTIAAFEWSAAPNGGNMHRNVLFRDLEVPDMPFSAIDSSDEEDLWMWMLKAEANGATLFAIPHNSNASKTQMFEPVDNSGGPLDAEYAHRRQHLEPLIEIMQVKGNSEVHRTFWPTDEFADFENADSMSSYSGREPDKRNYVRWAVIKGLGYRSKLGVNPFRFGFVGGTDSHNGTPGAVAENDFIGSHGAADGSSERRRTGELAGWIMGRDLNPGALTGVWAVKNTRAAIWDAMNERESFATSGPRIEPRFFCGVGLRTDLPTPAAMVAQGYADGVPMGGNLANAGDGDRLNCIVHAIKDVEGANLDRIQIIKGWIDDTGEPQERIVDVAWSGDRQPDESGRLPPVGNTVNLASATYSNSIGSPELTGGWSDDTFDPGQHAVYYVRVLEIPTPRWSSYDAVRNKEVPPDNVPATVQERAWTSPIWYTP